jgi:hypothetical protein
MTVGPGRIQVVHLPLHVADDEALFASPRNVLQVEAGGDLDARRRRVRCASVVWRLRIFRLIYAITALRIAPSALRSWWRKRRGVRQDINGEDAAGGHAVSAHDRSRRPLPSPPRRLSASTTSMPTARRAIAR